MNEELVSKIAELVKIELVKNGLLNSEYVPVGISARHIHLTREHVDILFGKNYQLKVLKPLSQPGQFAAEEMVDIIGVKGSIKKVRILGPERPNTQIEVARSEARILGLDPEVRNSGDIIGTPGVTIKGPVGEVTVSEGVIIADRHIHMSEDQAKSFNLKNGEKVKVIVAGQRGGVFDNVTIRAGAQYALDFHIDTDDANAFAIKQGQLVKIEKYQ